VTRMTEKRSRYVTGVDIWRAAHLMIEMHNSNAGWQAGLRADHLLSQGDMEGFRVWAKIATAITDLAHAKPSSASEVH
jgi:hypothetical protein